MVGYARLEGIGATRALSRLYASVRRFVNFFQPSFKLAVKRRDGSRIVKKYHAPATPASRLMESSSISEQIKARLRDVADKLDPLALLDEIRAMQHQLAALAKGEPMHTPVERNTDLAEFLAGPALVWKAGGAAGFPF